MGFAGNYSCIIIGIVRFWQIFVVDLVGNLTGTSLMTYMLCTIELMLAGLCINIPMLRPFYLRWRQKTNLSHSGSGPNGASGVMDGSKTGYLATATGKSHKDNSTWIELVRAIASAHSRIPIYIHPPASVTAMLGRE